MLEEIKDLRGALGFASRLVVQHHAIFSDPLKVFTFLSCYNYKF